MKCRDWFHTMHWAKSVSYIILAICEIQTLFLEITQYLNTLTTLKSQRPNWRESTVIFVHMTDQHQQQHKLPATAPSETLKLAYSGRIDQTKRHLPHQLRSSCCTLNPSAVLLVYANMIWCFYSLLWLLHDTYRVRCEGSRVKSNERLRDEKYISLCNVWLDTRYLTLPPVSRPRDDHDCIIL